MSFLPVNPRGFSFKFVRPRENTQADSGFYASRYTSVGFMEGTLRVPRFGVNTGGEDYNINKFMAALAKADRPTDAAGNGYFFADLVLPHQKEFPTPIWVTANEASSTTQIEVPPLKLKEGDIVSVRSLSAGVQNYVTARIATAVTSTVTTTTIDLNHPLPYEFLPEAVAKIQVCVNRPHVRAVFSDDAVQWSMDYNRIASVTALNWKEDTAGIIGALRAQDSSTPVTPPPTPGDGFITLENGMRLGLEDGSGDIALEP